MSWFSWFRRKRVERPFQSTPPPSGRRHIAGVPYVLPKDEREIERLDFQHYVLQYILKGNYIAPLGKNTVHTILDVGCGTGRWCREMAQAFPSADVMGLDIESRMNPLIELPKNLRFILGNVLQGLPVSDGSIDYTHQRLLVAAIPADKWRFVLQELLRVTRVGGWVEVVEGTVFYQNIGPAMQQMLTWADAASRKHGFDFSLVMNLGVLLKQAGLHDVTSYTVEAPLGSWGERQGQLLALDMKHIYEGLKDFYCQSLALDGGVFDTVLEALPDEWERYKTAYSFYVAYGQK